MRTTPIAPSAPCSVTSTTVAAKLGSTSAGEAISSRPRSDASPCAAPILALARAGRFCPLANLDAAVVKDVNEADFMTEVVERSRELPVIVDFWAEWCGPCRQLGPALEAAVAKRAGKVELAKVDVDSNQSLAVELRQFSGIPAVKAFRDGQVVAEFTGAIPPAQIEQWLDTLVPSQADELAAAGDEDSLRQALELDPGHPGRRRRSSAASCSAAATPTRRWSCSSRSAATSCSRASSARAQLAAANGDGAADPRPRRRVLRLGRGRSRDRPRVAPGRVRGRAGPRSARPDPQGRWSRSSPSSASTTSSPASTAAASPRRSTEPAPRPARRPACDPSTEPDVPVAFVAGLVSFLSPCVLPLVPGYLSAVTGVSLARARRRRTGAAFSSRACCSSPRSPWSSSSSG